MTREYFIKLCEAHDGYILKYFRRQNLITKINRTQKEDINNYSITIKGKESIGENTDEINVQEFVESWIWDWVNYFANVRKDGIPTGDTNRKNLVDRMCGFIERFYNWNELNRVDNESIKEEIEGATEIYFSEQSDDRYARRAIYFITKTEEGRTFSDLEDYIVKYRELVKNNEAWDATI